MNWRKNPMTFLLPAAMLFAIGATVVLAQTSGNNGLCGMTYCDTPVVTTTTLQIPTPYSLSCSPYSTSSIYLVWAGSDSSVSTIVVQAADTSMGILTSPQNLTTVNPAAGGSYTDAGLPPATTRYYRLMLYRGSRGTTFTTPISCPVAPLAANIPTLYAFSLSTSSIVLNWSDNVTTTVPYHFELQSMRATPLDPTPASVQATPVGVSPSGAGADVTFKNIDGKLPAFAVVEESATTTGQFGSGDTTVSLGTSTVASPGASATVSFTGLKELSNYYFRVQSCFGDPNQISPTSYTEIVAKLNGIFPNAHYSVNPESTSSRPCSNFYPAGSPYLSVMTLPYAPSNLSASISSDKKSVNLSWVNNSSIASGVVVRRNGCAPTTPVSLSSSATSYTDNSTLTSRCTYTYSVYASYNLPSGGQVYSAPATVNITYLSSSSFNDHTMIASIGGIFQNLLPDAYKALRSADSAVGNLVSLIGSGVDKMVAGLKGISVAEGQTSGGNLYDPYFSTITTPASSTYFYIDNNLLPGATYIYRIKVVYDGPYVVTSSSWSNLAAAPTFNSSIDCPDCGGGGGGGGICTAYGICQTGLTGGTPPVGSNCNTGADCTNVGKASSPIFKER